MPPEQEMAPARTAPTHLPIFIAGVVVALFIAIGYWYLHQGPTISHVIYTGEARETGPIELKGFFYYSAPLASEGLALGIRRVDLETKEKTTLVASTSSNGYPQNYYSALSHSGTMMAFSHKEASTTPAQIYVSDSEGRNMRQVTKSSTEFKGGARWNMADTLIAFEAQNASTTELDYRYPENWTIFITDLHGVEHIITTGREPVFSPDGTALLVAKNSGLYLYDISNLAKPVEKGIVIGRPTFKNMKIGVSKDASLLAWNSPKERATAVYDLSWQPFKATLRMSVRGTAYFTAFSPDNRYVAIEELMPKAGTEGYPVITVYDLANGKSVTALEFPNATHHYFWFSDWTY
jgi:Tol biopolymer transport system component